MRRFSVLQVGPSEYVVRDLRRLMNGLHSVSRVYTHIDDAQAVADWLTDRAAGYVPRAHNLIMNTGVTP